MLSFLGWMRAGAWVCGGCAVWCSREEIALWVGEGLVFFGVRSVGRAVALPFPPSRVGWAGGVCRCDAWALVRVRCVDGVSVRRWRVRVSTGLFCGYVGDYSLIP